ncbi:MAG: 16S rRNA (guanine(527)-N(7))-methyltransferase RsmG [Chloroflexota bacterium]|nr:16S rRNA (guanine(527)-N(7))-methyltransferase RsmG [Chloroflexota bacterium]
MKNLAQETYKLLEISLSPWQLSAVDCYMQELEVWNERYSLTAIRDPEKVLIKHFLDSFSCHRVMQATPMSKVIDIGTGAGFPGIPLKILFPDMQVTLVESVKKKADFCQHIVEKLNLKGIEVICERAERLGNDAKHRETYDWAIARAVAQLTELAEYLLPLVKVGGKTLAMKGDSGPVEAQLASEAFKLLGGHLRQLEHLNLPGVTEDRYLVVIDKIAPTPQKYPRRVGMPSKRPL